MDVAGGAFHGHLHGQVKVVVHYAVAQKFVALFERTAVAYKFVEVYVVAL